MTKTDDKLTLNDFIKIIKNINETLQDNIKFLSELDSIIGDGDHGITITRGFKNVMKKIEENIPDSISDLLKTTGFTIISTMGGTAGPIFGSIFTEMARQSNGKKSINLTDLYSMFLAAMNKVIELGGAEPGDKTMIDSFDPAVASLKESLSKNLTIKEALRNMSLAAERGALSTKNMVAKKGKSRYHAERSLGYQDAGATTFYLIIKTMYESI
jgi:dihydroxyacetone kinase-like protein